MFQDFFPGISNEISPEILSQFSSTVSCGCLLKIFQKNCRRNHYRNSLKTSKRIPREMIGFFRAMFEIFPKELQNKLADKTPKKLPGLFLKELPQEILKKLLKEFLGKTLNIF